jgi:D-glycero-alpha-D-manno-heptose-7-phosphate kinase
MKACARAPVRVDPAGGGTDAPPFCIDHGGAVVNFAVQRHAFAVAQRLDKDAGIILYAMDINRGYTAPSVAQLSETTDLEFLGAFVRRMVPDGDSLLLVTETDVPPGSGLGGSGALGVAIVAALDRLYGRERSPLESAALANDIERHDLGYPGGDQDSYAAALGGINYLQYHPGGGMTPHRLEISEETCRALEYYSLLIYSGVAHVSASIHEDIKSSYVQTNSPTLEAMWILKEQAETIAAALPADDLNGYAGALSESCRQLYNLHESCDSSEHRRYFQAIEDCILGGKTCGAGGGGFMVVLTKSGHRRECIRRIEQLGGLVWPVSIDWQGMASWLEPPLDRAEVERLRHLASSAS